MVDLAAPQRLSTEAWRPDGISAPGHNVCTRREFIQGTLSALLLTGVPSFGGERVETATEQANPKSGKLVIVGGGPVPKEVHDLYFDLAGGKDAEIYVLPATTRTADLPNQTVNMHWKGREADVKSAKLFHTRDRKEANKPEFVKPLETATGIWLPGGDQDLFAEAYLGTLVETAVENVLRRGGVVGGTSAGASLQSRVMIGGNAKEKKNGKTAARLATGLNLFPNENTVIDQHWHREGRYDRSMGIVEENPQHSVIGLEESTALIVNVRSRCGKVMGDKWLWVCKNGKEPTKVEPGRWLNLNTLELIAEEDEMQLNASLR